MPSDRFVHSVSISTDRATAWAHLQEAETWEALAGIDEVHNVIHDDEGQLISYEFVAVAGGKRYPGVAEVTESQYPDRLVLTIESPEIHGGIVTILRDDHPLELHVELELTSRGLLSTMLFPIVSATVGSGFPTQVDEFAARVAAD